jgi:hypothetical protein
MAQKAQIFDALLAGLRFDGATLSSGKAYFYSPGTTTAKTIYVDRNKQTTAANPYTLDINGRAEIFGDGVYDVVIKTAGGVTKATWENVAIQDVSTYIDNMENYASLNAAITAIGATPTRLLINSATSLTGNATVPATLEIVVTRAGSIALAGFSLAINGNFIAGRHQVFTGSGTVTRLKDNMPEWWGAKSDGVWVSGTDLYGATTGITCTGTDSTTAIAAAITAAKAGGGNVLFDVGTYLATAIPWDSGVNLLGKGTKKTASAGVAATSGTVIKQINGTNTDFVATPSADSWIESASIKGIRFIGDPTGAATDGAGLAVNLRLGENARVDDVRFDFFPDAGVKLTRGVQPGFFTDIHTFWNGYGTSDFAVAKGSGLYITRQSTDEMQSGSFGMVSGDSNRVAMIYVEGGTPVTNGSGLIFTNVKSEVSESGKQQDAMVFDNCQGLHITANNVNQINTGGEQTANSVFKIINSTTFSITAITKAADAEFTTSAAHGLSVGQSVRIASITGMTEFNNTVHAVKSVVSATKFTVEQDSSAYTIYTSGGNIRVVSKPLLSWTGATAETETSYILDDQLTATATQWANTSSAYTNGWYGYAPVVNNGIRFENNELSTGSTVLDYYKEQEFTPTISFGGASTGITYTTQNGRATRIGNRVFFTLHIFLSSKGSAVGDALISGLPFTSGDFITSAAIRVNGMASGVGDTHLQAAVNDLTATISPSKVITGGVVILTNTDFTDTSSIVINGHYEI